MLILVILFLKIKDTKLYVPVITLSARDNQKLSKLFGKGFESSLLEEYKRISENKDTINEYRYSPEPTFVGVNRLFVLVYTNHGDKAKRFNGQQYYLPKGIIKNYNVIINGKRTFIYDQSINADIKQYEEI